MRRLLTKVVGDSGAAMVRRFVMSVAAAAVGLALAAPAQAGREYGEHDSRPSYHDDHGTRFDGGHYFSGRDYSRFTHRYWFGKYGCYTYWHPGYSCWYYWYAQDNCYYPVSYITTATPVAETPPPNVETSVKQIVNVTNNSPGSATVGGGPAGTPLPPPPLMLPAPPGP